jgi:hypothetical protein
VEAPSQLAAAARLDAATAPDAAEPPDDAAAPPDAAAESPSDQSDSHAKTGKLFGFLAGSFDMAPPEEEAAPSPEPGAESVAAADETQAGAESEPHGEAEAPDAWSDVADPLAAEAPVGLEAGTDAAASEPAPADAPAEPEGGASIPVEWAEDVPLDQGSPADEQSGPAAGPAVKEFEEHQAQGAFGESSERAPSFDEAPPTDRIPFGEPAAEAPADDAFGNEGSQASEEAVSDDIALDDSVAGPAAAAEPAVEFSAGEERAEGDLPAGEAPSPDEIALEEPFAGEFAHESASEEPVAAESAAAEPSSWEPAAQAYADEEPGGEPANASLGLERYAVPGWVSPPPEPQPEGSGWLGQALASTPAPLSEAEEELLRAAGVEPSDGMSAMRLLAGLLRALQRRGVLEVSEVAADISAARSAGLDPPAPDQSGAEPDADQPV